MSTDTTTRRPFPYEAQQGAGDFLCPVCDGTGSLRHAERIIQNRGNVSRTSDGRLIIDSTVYAHDDEGDMEWMECSWCLADFEMPEGYDWT